ncbi:thiamine biosynthesis multifunctional protein ThiED-like isoform X2 [Mytilus galloprovincialis]|uniref:thiamine biosynthesis multifunctional protein ThiED-like isoform X2 n=1 Tax=Mytilus galloprovincialis TaxID=29158 RepID=UPI003F7CCDE2
MFHILIFFITLSGVCSTVPSDFVNPWYLSLDEDDKSGTAEMQDSFNNGSSWNIGGNITENKFSEWLWHETRKSRMESLNSSFVQGIKDGTLHPTYFGRYLIQDAVFCLDFSKALEKAATKSDGRLKFFLENEVKVYKSFGEGILNDLYVQNASSVKVGPECQGFIDHLLNVSLNEEPIYMIVASIPCERLWPWLGLVLNKNAHQFGPYKDWVMTYFSPAYDGYHKFEAIANAAYGQGNITKDKALQIYTKSMDGEAAFFNSLPVKEVN